MTISVHPDALYAIVTHSREQYPLEACGLLAGLRAPGGQRQIKKAIPLKNLAQSRERFEIDPKEQLAAVRLIRSMDLEPLGNFHSHPETPARPSGEDLRLYQDLGALYAIVRLASRVPDLKIFALAERDGQKTYEELSGIGEGVEGQRRQGAGAKPNGCKQRKPGNGKDS